MYVFTRYILFADIAELTKTFPNTETALTHRIIERS